MARGHELLLRQSGGPEAVRRPSVESRSRGDPLDGHVAPWDPRRLSCVARNSEDAVPERAHGSLGNQPPVLVVDRPGSPEVIASVWLHATSRSSLRREKQTVSFVSA